MPDSQPVPGKDFQDRLQQLRRRVPQIFIDPGTVLYIGARAKRHDYIEEFFAVGNVITVIEVFPRNVEEMRANQCVSKVIAGDVCEIEKHGLGKFDYVVWWHGPEHVTKKKAFPTIGKLEQMSRRAVIFGMPLGRVEQRKAYQNTYEAHRSFWYKSDWKKLGYRAVSIGRQGDMGSHLLAWKAIVP